MAVQLLTHNIPLPTSWSSFFVASSVCVLWGGGGSVLLTRNKNISVKITMKKPFTPILQPENCDSDNREWTQSVSRCPGLPVPVEPDPRPAEPAPDLQHHLQPDALERLPGCHGMAVFTVMQKALGLTFSSGHDGNYVLRKSPYALHCISQKLPLGCL